MKAKLLITFMTLLTLTSATAECLPKNPESLTDAKSLENILKIVEQTNLKQKEKYKLLDKLTSDEATAFIQALPENEKKELNSFLEKIKNPKESLFTIVESDEDPILLVNGLDIQDFPYAWVKPFHKLQKTKRGSYYFQWDKFDSMETNKNKLTAVIKQILSKHAGKNLTIIGYSAGGIVVTRSMDELNDDPEAKRIQFHTVAAPLFGYKAPALAYLGVPFAGKTSIEIGIGQYDKLKNKKLTQCHHWVTTNCELDLHTCDNKTLNPQLGPGDARVSSLPCGAENVIGYKDESHSSVLSRAFFDIIK